jgi:enamine deaminase RidA (YjgF/YER057c/UK114 family)
MARCRCETGPPAFGISVKIGFRELRPARAEREKGKELRALISSGSPFEGAIGYSRAVVDGEWIFVSGTTGFDYSSMTIAADPAEQARQAIRNVAAALAEAGAGLADVVRVRYYLVDAAAWEAVVPVLGEAFGAIRPAATALLCGLVDPRMKFEIEVTARRNEPCRPS